MPASQWLNIASSYYNQTQCQYTLTYQASPNTRYFEKAEIDEMLAENLIGPAQTEGVVTIVLVHKKDGTLRFYNDYCKFNKVTKWGSYPMQARTKS